MKRNMGTIDRIVRILLAAAVAVLYFTGQLTGTAAIVLGILAEMKHEWFLKALGAVGLAASLLIAGCSLNPPAGTPVASAGIMTKGSAILNGVRYEDSAASISAEDTPKTAADLANGMRIKLKGTRNDDGLTGTADQIEVENEVRGSITAVDAASQSFTVLGQEVFADANTVYANGTAGNLLVNAEVEVHGQRSAAGDILASRVEFGGAGDDELRGVVTARTGTTFGLVGSSLTFTYDVSTVIVGGTSFANGDLVEVHLSGLAATRIELENAEDAEFELEGEQELQGFVSDFTGHPGSFLVDGQQVTTSAATRFEDGAASDLENDMVVEARGQFSGGVLLADKIKFKDSMRLQDNAPANDSANLLGKTVVVNGLTEYGGGIGALGDIVSGDGLRVRGFLNASGTITATRVTKLSNAVVDDEKILQGVVTSISASDSLVIAGITVLFSGNPAISGDDPPADLTAFFARLVANRTVVKARGTVSGANLTANEVSIE